MSTAQPQNLPAKPQRSARHPQAVAIFEVAAGVATLPVLWLMFLSSFSSTNAWQLPLYLPLLLFGVVAIAVMFRRWLFFFSLLAVYLANILLSCFFIVQSCNMGLFGLIYIVRALINLLGNPFWLWIGDMCY